MFRYYFLLTCSFFLSAAYCFAQQDTLPARRIKDSIPASQLKDTTLRAKDTLLPDSAKLKAAITADTVVITKAKDTTSKKRSPASRAALLSAVLPGAGQAYNKKYWKMPIVYGALAIPVYTFTYNLKWFNRTRYAFNVLFTKDTANYVNVYPELQPFVAAGDQEGLKNYRAEFRKNVDYSALAFLLLWGLNVMDAAVDGHLSEFNVTDDLSLQLKPGFSPITNTAGLSVVLNIGKKRPSHIYATR